MTIDKCPKCKKIFKTNKMLQTRIAHEVKKHGTSAGKTLLIEQLLEEHFTHQEKK